MIIDGCGKDDVRLEVKPQSFRNGAVGPGIRCDAAGLIAIEIVCPEQCRIKVVKDGRLCAGSRLLGVALR